MHREQFWFFAIRVIVGLFISGTSALLAQASIFVYTRSEGILIPASDIFSLSSGGASEVVSIAAFIVILIFLAAQFLFSATGSLSNSWRYLKGATVLVISIPLLFCAFPKLTASALRYLGQGGGVDVWLYTSDDTNSENAIQVDFENALREDFLKITISRDLQEIMPVPAQEPVLMSGSKGVPWKVFGKLLLLTPSHAYVKMAKTDIFLNFNETRILPYNPHTIYRVSRNKINLADHVLLQ